MCYIIKILLNKNQKHLFKETLQVPTQPYQLKRSLKTQGQIMWLKIMKGMQTCFFIKALFPPLLLHCRAWRKWPFNQLQRMSRGCYLVFFSRLYTQIVHTDNYIWDVKMAKPYFLLSFWFFFCLIYFHKDV